MLAEYFYLLLVCGDGVVVVGEDGIVCGGAVVAFVVKAAYELE